MVRRKPAGQGYLLSEGIGDRIKVAWWQLQVLVGSALLFVGLSFAFSVNLLSTLAGTETIAVEALLCLVPVFGVNMLFETRKAGAEQQPKSHVRAVAVHSGVLGAFLGSAIEFWPKTAHVLMPIGCNFLIGYCWLVLAAMLWKAIRIRKASIAVMAPVRR
jgi:hypothetical protein